jgi:hypothetical protein
MRTIIVVAAAGILLLIISTTSSAGTRLASVVIDSSDAANHTLSIGGSVIDVHFSDASLQPKRELLLDWIVYSAQVVHHYYGRFPVDKVSLALLTYNGGGVDGGKQLGGELPVLNIRVGNLVSQQELDDDWIMVHEMVHLALADLPHFNRWFEEGLAVYVESISRAQLGALTEEFVWRGFLEGMPHGIPKTNDRGLDNTPTWGRRYWGGALFCLLADIEIRKTTNNRRSLQDALRAIVDAGYSTNIDSMMTPLLQVGDKATGVNVLLPMYEKMRADPTTPDLATLWKSLGVSLSGDTVVYDDTAPLAHIRRQLMKKKPAPQ